MCDTNSCGPSTTNSPLIEVTDKKRRAFLQGLASLPLAAVLADPRLARAAGEGLEPITISAGEAETSGFLAEPATTPAPAVLVIHEWWGLNDQIKAITAELANEGFLALAVDLYGGKVATTPDEAKALRLALDVQRARAALASWVEWLRKDQAATGKVGTVGWCFGGGWSLNASLAAPVDATVIYYGDVRKTAEELKLLRGPVLGHFGTLDQRIDAEMVGDFERAMAQAGKTDLTVHWYVADHAFANPTGARYDGDDAKLAWARTLTFFHRHLG